VRRALAETRRRREIQRRYNRKHNIQPRSITKEIRDLPRMGSGRDRGAKAGSTVTSGAGIIQLIDELTRQMRAAAEDLDFERAAELRDRIRELAQFHLKSG